MGHCVADFETAAAAGGILFDPFGLSKDVATFEDNKVKEIKNGRLAMVAWAGFFAQVRSFRCLAGQHRPCLMVHCC